MEKQEAVDGWVLLPSTFGERLRMVRLHTGLDQAEIAERCGFTQVVWSRWEHNKYLPTHYPLVCEHIAKVTGCSSIWLMTGHIPSDPRPRKRTHNRVPAAGLEPATLGSICPGEGAFAFSVVAA